jgi:pteridine reductase
MSLDGKVAIVTGGAVRLGRALSLALANAGASVVVHYSHSESDAVETLRQIAELGRDAVSVSADLSHSTAASKQVMTAAIAHFGRVDILVNSAAIFEPGTLASTTEAQWDKHFSINLKSAFFLSQEFATRRTTGQSGVIINIADWRGLHPVPGNIAYSLTKSGIVMLTRLLAQELAPEVRVNAIAPGAILPPPGRDQHDLEKLAEQIPLRRSGSTDDVTSAALYLIQADYVTGEVLYVTGGQHLL